MYLHHLFLDIFCSDLKTTLKTVKSSLNNESFFIARPNWIPINWSRPWIDGSNIRKVVVFIAEPYIIISLHIFGLLRPFSVGPTDQDQIHYDLNTKTNLL